MGRDIQWREAVVRLLVAARPMTMAARVESGDSAMRALAGWGSEAWGDGGGYIGNVAHASTELMRGDRGPGDVDRNSALDGVSPISLVGRRPMGVRTTVGIAPARRPREVQTWRERWPDQPAARGARGANAR
jgi:hypothetical protein